MKDKAKEKVTTIAPACARERKQRVVYSDDLLSSIFERVCDGESINKICSEETMPSRKTFFEWVGNDPTIKDRYETAILVRAELLAEEIIDISDDSSRDTIVGDDGTVTVNYDVIARSRLRVDARKWLASKMAPKKYGDKITQEHTGPNGAPLDLSVNFVTPK